MNKAQEFSRDVLQLQTDNGSVWRPIRPVGGKDLGIQIQVDSLTKKVSEIEVSGTGQVEEEQPPTLCRDLAAVESPYKTADGTLKSLVSVSFDNGDPNFDSADIYFTGYHGSSNPEFVANGKESPISFLCETTKEEVTVTVVALAAKGASLPFEVAPKTLVRLDGVASPPPPPSISKPLVRSPLGYTFSFNAEEGLLADIIDGYGIYRNDEDNTATATQIQYIKQNPQNTGEIQVQDVQELNNSTSYFYWVSAVNTSGLESTLEPAGLTTRGAYAQQVKDVDAQESPYKTQSGQLVSLVTVDFTRVLSDPYFDKVQIWFTGYNGNVLPQLMAEGSESPISFLCETTHEKVTVVVVPVSSNGIANDNALKTWNGVPVVDQGTWDAANSYSINDLVFHLDDNKFYIALRANTNVEPPSALNWVEAPITTVSLDGVASAPPQPSIAQEQVPLPGDAGWQFGFNVLKGLVEDLIDGYWVYHSTDKSTPPTPAQRYQYIKQSATNQGVCTVQEVTQEEMYYWVSAVNVGGAESELTWVPMTYVDPGDPAPPPIPDVVVTKVIQPKTFLNGWGPYGHVGDYPHFPYTGTPTTYGETTTGYGYKNYKGTVTWIGSSPDFAVDGNEGNYAMSMGWHKTCYFGCVWKFQDFVLPASSYLNSVKLTTVTETCPTAGPVHGRTSMWYSPDAGTSWTNIVSTNWYRRYKTADTVEVPVAGLDINNLQVMGFAMNDADLEHRIFSISAEVTYTTLAGPPKILGVYCTLNDDGQVTVNWQPSKVTVTKYEVYRVNKGGGYTASRLVATVVAGGATQWTDVSAHDSSYDYYVIAYNGDAYSNPSNAASLYDATTIIFQEGVTLPAKLQYVNADGTISDSTSLNPQGSINPQGVTASGSLVGTIYGGVPAIKLTFTNGEIYCPNGEVWEVTVTSPQYFTTWANTTVAYSTEYNANIVFKIKTTEVKVQQFIGAQTIANNAQSWMDGFVPLNIGIDLTTPADTTGEGGTGGGGGGGTGCFSGDTRVQVPSGTRTFEEIEAAGGKCFVRTKFGDFPAQLLVHEAGRREMVDMGDGELVTFDHLIWSNDEKRAVPAVNYFENCPRVLYDGKVYNLSILDARNSWERWYILGNGEIVSNMKARTEMLAY